jgi:hypothetical protein
MYRHHLKTVLGFVLAPIYLGSAATLLIALSNYRRLLEGGYNIVIATVAAAAFAAAALSLFAAFFTARLARRNARYTFLDIGEEEIVFSRYGGEIFRDGRRIIYRELAVVPLSELSSMKFSRVGGNISLVCNAKIYHGRDESMGYHFESGSLVFDEWDYNFMGFKSARLVKIPPVFSKQLAIADEIMFAKKNYDAIK